MFIQELSPVNLTLKLLNVRTKNRVSRNNFSSPQCNSNRTPWNRPTIKLITAKLHKGFRFFFCLGIGGLPSAEHMFRTKYTPLLPWGSSLLRIKCMNLTLHNTCCSKPSSPHWCRAKVWESLDAAASFPSTPCKLHCLQTSSQNSCIVAKKQNTS